MVQRSVAHDFTGGQAGRLASTHFTERQWAKLKGVVLESDAEVRSQWPWEPVGADIGFTEVGYTDGLLVALDGNGAIWTTPFPDPSADPSTATWTELTAAPSDTGYRLCGLVPLPRDEGQGFVTALLVNGRERTEEAVAVYEDGDGNPAHYAFTSSYPNDTDDDAMPRANLSIMWGDFLVLGDIEWLEDEDANFASTNAGSYPHALWLAQPGEPESWDLLDVVYTGIKTGQGAPQVLGLETVDTGLMVLTSGGVYHLRGTPSQFDYEELRPGNGVAGRFAASWWPSTGAAVWLNQTGQVWHSNGEAFLRLDEPLGLDAEEPSEPWAAGWDDFVLVGRSGRTFVFRAFDEDGAWTELVTPDGVHNCIPVGATLYGVDGDGRVWRLNRTSQDRGQIDGTPHEVVVATRTFEGGEGHRLSFWRHFGIRAEPESPGATLEQVTVYAGPALSSESESMTLLETPRPLDGRDELVVPGPGPALEAAVEVEFAGDVSVEQVSVAWVESRGSN